MQPAKETARPEIKPLLSEITIDDFGKVDIRVGKILEARTHQDAKKLLVLRIDTGDKIRNIVSGIAEFYEPEDLIGKSVQVIVNLKPVKLRGELSEGMILAGENAKKELVVAFVEDKLNPGSKIS